MNEQEIQAVLEEINASVAEAIDENPDVNEDDVYHEVANSVLMMAEPELRKEVRFRLGFDWREGDECDDCVLSTCCVSCGRHASPHRKCILR